MVNFENKDLCFKKKKAFGCFRQSRDPRVLAAAVPRERKRRRAEVEERGEETRRKPGGNLE